tara:strand:+ start:560 stop:946 length:387 start_codon:yes stop_codon:yes gene_type:complete
MSSDLSEILSSINNTKEHMYVDDPDRIKSYPPYIINRCLSGHVDSILFANAMNLNGHLDKRLQYDFLLNSLRKRKRFTPWLKKEQIDNLDLVKAHYGYSNEKAKIAVSLLTNTQLEYIRKKHEKGGRQ